MKMAKRRKFPIKACVAAAALCAAGAANADDSSVTLYGIADAGLMYLSHSTPAFNGGTGAGREFQLTNSGYSPSLWGLKGTEDLGGGLKAEFKLESGINLANGGFDNPGGNNGLFNRTADVGLSGGFGKVMAGLQLSPFFEMIFDLDPRGTSEFGSMLIPVSENSLIAAIFMPNAVTYTSPNIAGFQFAALYSLGGVAGSFQTGRAYSVGAKYTNGTLLVGAAYINVNNAADSALASVGELYPANVRAYTAGASYKFGGLTAKASFANFKANSVPVSVDPALANSTNTSVNIYSGGVDYFALPDLDLNAGVYYQQDRVNSGGHSVMGAIGTQFFLSKRTSLYAQVGVVNNTCARDGVCLGSGLSVESGGSGVGGLQGLGTAAEGLGLPPGTTVGADVGIRMTF
ncbi:porin [Paraburkholderia sp. RP-4-7]|uniref:Porin n=1 Tax=Paraburkholderia polaris TaxID=2728848 RepID=A0A848IRG7_9BURK|nr:porin [Paraburkholderia polaris]NMM02789.1 porin [Paraburkholderia polaris]